MSWGGSDSGSWGSSPWGSGTSASEVSPPTPSVGAISTVDLLSQTVIRINFNTNIKCDSNLRDTSNFNVTPLLGSAPTSVKAVVVPKGLTTSSVLLTVERLEVGGTYRVSAINLRTSAGGTFSPASEDVVSRITKVDYILDSSPPCYNKDLSKSAIATVLTAIALEDDLIGGG